MFLAVLMFLAVVTLYAILRCFDRSFRKFSERGIEMALLLMLVHSLHAQTNTVNANGNISTVFQVAGKFKAWGQDLGPSLPDCSHALATIAD